MDVDRLPGAPPKQFEQAPLNDSSRAGNSAGTTVPISNRPSKRPVHQSKRGRHLTGLSYRMVQTGTRSRVYSVPAHGVPQMCR